MPNQYSSEKKTIGELLSLTSPNIRVPDWQRSYSWDTSQIDTFWQDLLDVKKAKYRESDLLLTSDLDKYESWNMDTIDERQAELGELAPAIWSFPTSRMSN